MARETRKSSRIARMRGAVARAARKLFRRERIDEPMEVPARSVSAAADERRARPRRLQTDVPFDVISNAYTPTQTSLKGPFRASGADHQRDQDDYVAEGRWNDEDRFTNKSGDPRIGTHGRSYEPGESRGGQNR
jgi:hypothetical protein